MQQGEDTAKAYSTIWIGAIAINCLAAPLLLCVPDSAAANLKGGLTPNGSSRSVPHYTDVSPRPPSGKRLSPANELGSPGGWSSSNLLETSVGGGDFADEIEAELAAVAAAGAAGVVGSAQTGPRAGGL